MMQGVPDSLSFHLFFKETEIDRAARRRRKPLPARSYFGKRAKNFTCPSSNKVHLESVKKTDFVNHVISPTDRPFRFIRTRMRESI